MARRGKTVIGGGAKEQSRTMMQAAESGMAARQRAQEGVSAAQRHGMQMGMQLGGQWGQALQQHEQQQFREEAETGRQAQAQQRIDLEAAARGLQRQPGGPESPLLARQARMEEEMARGAQDQGAPTADAASAAEAAGGVAGGAGAALDPEAQQRLADQAQRRDLEMRDRGGFVPTEAAKQAAQFKRGIQKSEVQAKLTNAAANMLNARANYARATAQGGDKGNENALKAAQAMEKSMATTTETINDVINNKTDWRDVARSYADNPNMQQALEADDDVMGKQAVTRLMRSQLGAQQVSYMATTGLQPPGMDPDNPVIQQFNARFSEVAASFRALQGEGVVSFDQPGVTPFEQAAQGQDRPMLSEAWRGFTTYDQRNQFLRKVTARVMQESDRLRRQADVVGKASGFMGAMAEKDRMIADQAAQLQEYQRLFGQRPSTIPRAETEMRQGRGPEGEPVGRPVPVHETPGGRAVREARERGATTSEAIRAGQKVEPTRGQRKRSRYTRPPGVRGGISGHLPYGV